jgi:Ricin-type beta-trefoil lectin domain-like
VLVEKGRESVSCPAGCVQQHKHRPGWQTGDEVALTAEEEIVAMRFVTMKSALALGLLLFLAGQVTQAQASWFIQSLGTGKFLDDPGFSEDRGTLIQQFEYNGGLNQQWEIVDLNNGYYVIVNEWSGKVLDVPGFATHDNVQIQQYTFNGGTNQQWELVYDDDTGSYEIINRHSRKVLDVPNGSPEDGVIIQQYHDNGGGRNQRWLLLQND